MSCILISICILLICSCSQKPETTELFSEEELEYIRINDSVFKQQLINFRELNNILKTAAILKDTDMAVKADLQLIKETSKYETFMWGFINEIALDKVPAWYLIEDTLKH